MKKSYTMADALKDAENRVRKQAQEIVMAKELGLSQHTIEILLEWFAIAKREYDDIKQRYEAHGK